MKKLPARTTNKIGTRLLRRICANEGSLRDREMLVTVFVVAFEALQIIESFESINKEWRYTAMIKQKLKLMENVLNGKVAIKYGKIVKLKHGVPPN